MGGWEVLIALFGGAWYVVSAIAAAKEKKKKQAQRRSMMEQDPATLKTDDKRADKQANVSFKEKAKAASMLRTNRPSKSESPKLTLKTGKDDARTLRKARKAILESMRQDLGLAPSKPSLRPSAKPVGPTAVQPPVTPAGVIGAGGTLVVPGSTVLQLDVPHPIQGPSRTRKPPAQQPASRMPPPRRRQPTAARPAGLTGQGLQALLQKRSGLKQAFILAEVVQPPVSMRSEHLGS